MVAVLLMAGVQEPLIPLVDVVGSGAIAEPVQAGGTATNVGVTLLFTTTCKVVLRAHCPGFGVKV